MSVWDDLKQILSDAYHVLGLLNPGGGSKPGGDQDTIRAADRVWGEQYQTLSEISSLLDSTVMTHLRSGAVLTGTGPIGVAQAWNDPAGDMFQSYWQNVKSGIDRQASAFKQMQGVLNVVAHKVQGFNDSVVMVRTQLEAWAGITAVLFLIGFVTEGGTDLVAVLRIKSGLSLIERGKQLLTEVMDLYKAGKAWHGIKNAIWAFDFFKAVLKQETVVFGVRLAERWAVNGDPSAGWSKYDPTQILAFGGLLAGFNWLLGWVDKNFWAPRVTDPRYAFEADLQERLLGLSRMDRRLRNLVWRPTVSVTQNLTWNNLQALLITHARDFGKINGINLVWVPPTAEGVGVLGLRFPKLGMRWSTTGMVAFNTIEEIIYPPLRLARGLYMIPAVKDLSRIQPAMFQPTPAGLMPIGMLPVQRVVPGDNLWNIAEHRYGNGLYYPDLAEDNRIQNPNLIYPGQYLTLPGVPLAPALSMPAPSDP